MHLKVSYEVYHHILQSIVVYHHYQILLLTKLSNGVYHQTVLLILRGFAFKNFEFEIEMRMWNVTFAKHGRNGYC